MYIRYSEIAIESYNVFKANSKNENGDGCLMYIRNTIPNKKLCSFSNDTSKLLALSIKELNLLLVAIHRSPKTENYKFLHIFHKVLRILSIEMHDNICIIGNFNMPFLK